MYRTICTSSSARAVQVPILWVSVKGIHAHDEFYEQCGRGTEYTFTGLYSGAAEIHTDPDLPIMIGNFNTTSFSLIILQWAVILTNMPVLLYEVQYWYWYTVVVQLLCQSVLENRFEWRLCRIMPPIENYAATPMELGIMPEIMLASGGRPKG